MVNSGSDFALGALFNHCVGAQRHGCPSHKRDQVDDGRGAWCNGWTRAVEKCCTDNRAWRLLGMEAIATPASNQTRVSGESAEGRAWVRNEMEWYGGFLRILRGLRCERRTQGTRERRKTGGRGLARHVIWVRGGIWVRNGLVLEMSDTQKFLWLVSVASLARVFAAAANMICICVVQFRKAS